MAEKSNPFDDAAKDFVQKARQYLSSAFNLCRAKVSTFFEKEEPLCLVCRGAAGRWVTIVHKDTGELLYNGHLCDKCIEKMLKVFKDSKVEY